jgi:leucyl-tRNA synthetase
MAEYNYKEIEKTWQQFWKENKTFRAENNSSKPKYYSLDMFPYPSGAGLHVGHPLGYIASDIVSRYKRHQGFNVLHPMGFDSFGLPAEQYAIQTGQHPAITTEQNIARYIEQLQQIGFSFDWDREVRTSDPNYYKWTQWIFMQLFNSWYNYETDKAEPIETLIAIFEKEGNSFVKAACDEDTPHVTADAWNRIDEKQKQEILLKYRLTFLSEAMVNWCPALGTVLANDEVKDGLSERGGYPVERKRMRQWSMRITAYADRLLQGLEDIDWPEPVKEMQRNWIGKSIGAELHFPLENTNQHITVFTTRIDTVFGATFLVLAPEHELVPSLITPEHRAEAESYVEMAKNRSERDRMTDVKTVSGAFTGSYATNPISGERVPIWVADYVLAGYGTGAVMAVPAHDSRDYAFAKHFNYLGYNLPIREVVAGGDIMKEAYAAKEGTIINSGFMDGMNVKEAITAGINKAEELGVGKGKVNFRMRDAVFSRQRYWGEPVPVYFKDGVPNLLDEKELPLVLPEIDEYKPTETGEPPLGRAKDWKYSSAYGTSPDSGEEYEFELSTMPGWAGSSWYWYRYMDPKNDTEFASKSAIDYWENVDLYIGGSEHATGHLLYSRFWNQFLFDLGLVPCKEPFKKLINQGMIQGVSRLVKEAFLVKKSEYVQFNSNPNVRLYRGLVNSNIKRDNYLGKDIANFEDGEYVIHESRLLHIDINLVDANSGYFNIEGLRQLFAKDLRFRDLDLNKSVEYLTDKDGNNYLETFSEVEKMSKSKYNVVNPDDLVEKFGADTLRMYEMFLGPLEQFKPWNTSGMDGVHKFLKRFWRLFHDEQGNYNVSTEEPTSGELKTLHKTIKKVEEDIERFSFNTSVSTFMICVNELTAFKTNKRAILEPLVITLSPYAPHISEELWRLLGHKESVAYAPFPVWEEKFLTESEFEYPVSVNGKTRGKITFPTDKPKEEIEKEVLVSEIIQKYLEGKTPKKVIVVPNKIVNVVV